MEQPPLKNIREERVRIETQLCERIQDDMHVGDTESLRKHLKALNDLIFYGLRPEMKD